MGAMSTPPGHLPAPQPHDVIYAGKRALGSRGFLLWPERFNSPSPTIATLTYLETAVP